MLRSHGWACPELSRPRSTTGVGTTAISRWRTSGTAVRQARRPLRLLRHHREYRATRPALPAGRKVVAQAAGPTNAPACPILGQLQRDPRTPPTAPPSDRPSLRRAQPSSPVKNRMREICTSGTVGGEGGNILAYPAGGGGGLRLRIIRPTTWGRTPGTFGESRERSASASQKTS